MQLDHTGTETPAKLSVRRFGIDTHQEPVIYMRGDCPVCRSEGFTARSRVLVKLGSRECIATLNVVRNGSLKHSEAGLSEAAWAKLSATEGAEISIHHPAPLASMRNVRSKIYGNALGASEYKAIVSDIVGGKYTDIEIAAFLGASASHQSGEEIAHLTQAMIDAGDRLQWPAPKVVDKHCVGGLPGNRTTPIVVAIVSAAGLTIPKTSSRAITSPAGTADTMEVLAPVNLSVLDMRRVVEREGGCIVWGGSVRLSPADDILIRIEKALDIDATGQLVASVLSKKVAAGSTHVLIDIPVGPTAKVRDPQSAADLSQCLIATGQKVGLHVETLISDGTQPVGRGIGPALEAVDLLAVLENKVGAPADLRDRALALSARVLEMGGACAPGHGRAKAVDLLGSGAAWRKFVAICEAQGGMRQPGVAPLKFPVVASSDGEIESVDNRIIAKTAKLAGAPEAPLAGVEMHVKSGDQIVRGQPLFTIHAQANGELSYALDFLRGVNPIRLKEPV